MSEIKIKTPYGEKNWSFVKRLFDSHVGNVEAMKSAVEWIRTAIKDEDESKLSIAIDRLEKAIANS